MTPFDWKNWNSRGTGKVLENAAFEAQMLKEEQRQWDREVDVIILVEPDHVERAIGRRVRSSRGLTPDEKEAIRTYERPVSRTQGTNPAVYSPSDHTIYLPWEDGVRGSVFSGTTVYWPSGDVAGRVAADIGFGYTAEPVGGGDRACFDLPIEGSRTDDGTLRLCFDGKDVVYGRCRSPRLYPGRDR